MHAAWRDSAPGQYIDLEWRAGNIYLEDGPDDWPRRAHEGGGGTYTMQEIRQRGRELFSAYDGLYDRITGDLAAQFRVSDTLHGVVITLDDAMAPCPTPCRFAFNGNRVYVYPATAEPSEQLPTTAHATLLVTSGAASDASAGAGEALPRWDRIQGPAKLVDDPEWELARAAELRAAKYGDTAAAESSDVPTIRIDIEHWTSHSEREPAH